MEFGILYTRLVKQIFGEKKVKSIFEFIERICARQMFYIKSCRTTQVTPYIWEAEWNMSIDMI